jgi:exopolyphosphatase / guanosine-5'-triphosphate,3'-diphosphate pyrophosphatase
VEVVVTAPGRQAENGQQLVAALVHAAQAPVRVLSPQEEARLAFAGAVGRALRPRRVVAVVDLGGASTEIALGRPETGPAWSRSVDLGALRLISRFLDESSPSGETPRPHAAPLARRSQESPRRFRAAPSSSAARRAPSGRLLVHT